MEAGHLRSKRPLLVQRLRCLLTIAAIVVVSGCTYLPMVLVRREGTVGEEGEGTDEPELEAKVGTERVELRDTPFKNVLLIVHCPILDRDSWKRGSKTSNATAVCEKRRPLFRNLEPFFQQILYWRAQVECGPGGNSESPHSCITSFLETEQAKRCDGIFYMHFDALVRPEVLKHHFSLNSIGTFNDQDHCNIETGCNWNQYGDFKENLQEALGHLPEKFRPEKPGFWLGMDDLFYIPRQAFRDYAELAPYFGKIHHEVAGPTMWRILARSSRVNVVSLGCMGDCCEQIPGPEALRPSFRCGHPFRLNEKETRILFQKAMALG